MVETNLECNSSKMPSTDIIAVDIPMPTYLQDIFRSRRIINLVYKKFYPTENGLFHAQPNLGQPKEDCELIGNPLVVDLSQPDGLDKVEQGRKPHNWTYDEATYGPMDTTEAKDIINKPKKLNLTQVCLVNSKDSRKTLCLFRGNEDSTLFYRGSVHYVGYFATKDNEASFSTLLKQHYRFCESNDEVKCSVNTLVPIFGCIKRCAEDVMHKHIEDSAFIEVFSEDKQFDSLNNMFKLHLQINAGQETSILHPLWEQLKLINKFINYLQDEDDLKSIVISSNPEPFHLVADKITALLQTFDTKQYEAEKDINMVNLNVMDMRHYDFFDKLFTTLLSLEDLSQILESFHTFFTDLVDEPRTEVNILNKSTLAVIINGLISGNMAVPTLTLASSLRFLIELGLNKLHNDYLRLIQTMDNGTEAQFKEQWDLIAETNAPKTTMNARKSRMTIAKGNQNTGQLIKQLNHIGSMHLITSFMKLARNCNLVGVDALSQVFDKIYKSNAVTKSFKTLQSSPVVDFDCELFSNQYTLIHKITPIAINVNLFTKCRGKSTLTTIFHFSSLPIFPPSIFGSHEVAEKENEEKKYYMHKAHIFVN